MLSSISAYCSFKAGWFYRSASEAASYPTDKAYQLPSLAVLVNNSCLYCDVTRISKANIAHCTTVQSRRGGNCYACAFDKQIFSTLEYNDGGKVLYDGGEIDLPRRRSIKMVILPPGAKSGYIDGNYRLFTAKRLVKLFLSL